MTLLRSFAIAPLTAPALYWLMRFVAALVDDNRRRLALQNPFASMAIIFAFGAPIAYAATLVAGVPLVYLRRRGHTPGLVPTVLCGALTGVATALAIRPFLRGDLFSVTLSPADGAILGAATAAVLWSCLRRTM